jgi:cell wall-associated NlpC family hydrolase
VLSRRISPVLLTLITATLVLVMAGTALATPTGAKKQRAREIRRQVAALDIKLEKVVEQYNLANVRLDTVRKQIEKNAELLKIARCNLAVANNNLTQRAIALYKERPIDVLDVVFSTSSFDELITQLDLLKKLGEHDVEIIDAVEQYKQQVTDRRTSLLADRTAATGLLGQVAAKKTAIEHALAARKRMLRGVEAEIRRMEAAEAARAAARVHPGTIPQRPIIPGTGGPGHPEVCAVAARYLGIPYRYGGASPATGFDCSGFVMYVYAQIGIGLPHYSGAQQQMGTPVPMNALQPGDLVFRGFPAYHVGIYVGSGSVIHSPHTGAVVSYQSVGGWTSAVRL